MRVTNLHKAGGSIMLVVPLVFLGQLRLQAGATVGLAVDHGYLMVNPNLHPRYMLAELLAVSDYSQSQSADERKWADAPAVGGELL